MCSTSCAPRASRKVVVNVHYLADAVEAHLASRAHGLEVVISDERKLLMETGGGLVQAAPLIDSDPFLALNSDNLWIDGPADTLRLLASHWDGEKMDALLLLVPLARALNHRGMGDFHMDRTGRLRRRERSHVAPFVFTGIQMVSKRLARRCAGRAVFDQYPVGPGDCGRALLRRRPPGPVVRCRHARSRFRHGSGTRGCLSAWRIAPRSTPSRRTARLPMRSPPD